MRTLTAEVNECSFVVGALVCRRRGAREGGVSAATRPSTEPRRGQRASQLSGKSDICCFTGFSALRRDACRVITGPVIRVEPPRRVCFMGDFKGSSADFNIPFHCLSSSKFPPGALRGFSHSADNSRNACKEAFPTLLLVNYNLYSYYK